MDNAHLEVSDGARIVSLLVPIDDEQVVIDDGRRNARYICRIVRLLQNKVFGSRAPNSSKAESTNISVYSVIPIASIRVCHLESKHVSGPGGQSIVSPFLGVIFCRNIASLDEEGILELSHSRSVSNWYNRWTSS